MRKLTVVLNVDLPDPDPDKVDAEIEIALNALHLGMVCYPVEIELSGMCSEPDLRKAYEKAGLTETQIVASFEALRRLRKRDTALMKALWESRMVAVNPV